MTRISYVLMVLLTGGHQALKAQVTTSEVKVETTSNNYTGIGSTSPTATLSLKGLNNNRVLDGYNISDDLMFMINTLSGNPYISFYNATGVVELLKLSTVGSSFIKSSQVAIGSDSPTATLTLRGISNNRVLDGYQGGTSKLMFMINTSSGWPDFSLYNNLGTSVSVKLNSNGDSYFNGGNLGIGTTTPGYKLDVNGSLNANSLYNSGQLEWSDFVFNEDYDLPDLSLVEKYIEKNGHLPEIPSESEVIENGYNIGNMDAKLLQKIEELTLYVIAQNKRIKHLEDEVSNLRKK